MPLLLELSEVFFLTFTQSLINPIFWVVVFLIFRQYKRVAGLETRLFGRVINDYWKQIGVSIGLGILGGFLASIILVSLGLSLEQIGLGFIWAVAILLLLIHPRFLCFAYAGGIVGIAVIAGRALVSIYPAAAAIWPMEALLKIHIPALLVLIALLHLVEALLIYIGGHWGSSPLYFKQAGGEVVGGFSLQRFWPLPLVALLVTLVAQPESAGVSMPQWWPVIKSTLQPGPGQTLQYLAIPVAAGMGYADLALSSTPREKSIVSSRHLALYSIALLGLAVAAEFYPWFILPGILLAPLGHEALVIYGNRREMSRRPRFKFSSEGVQVMMVLPNSPAFRAGLREADIIQKVNGAPVVDYNDFISKIENSYFMVLLEGIREETSLSTVLKKEQREGWESASAGHISSSSVSPPPHSSLHRGADLGLIMVPSPHSPVYVEAKRAAPMGWLRRLVGRRKTS